MRTQSFPCCKNRYVLSNGVRTALGPRLRTCAHIIVVVTFLGPGDSLTVRSGFLYNQYPAQHPDSAWNHRDQNAVLH
jgi:hypothetical protein